MSGELWVMGATGRTGRAIAKPLLAAGAPLVLVGRDRGRLEAAAADLGGAPRLLAGSHEELRAELKRDPPAVVINTVGPFTGTGRAVARACPPGTHYVDVANELSAVQEVLELDREAADSGRVFVTGSGFGVLATESVVLSLCEGQPPPSRVRVDAVASVAIEPGAERSSPTSAQPLLRSEAPGSKARRSEKTSSVRDRRGRIVGLAYCGSVAWSATMDPRRLSVSWMSSASVCSSS